VSEVAAGRKRAGAVTSGRARARRNRRFDLRFAVDIIFDHDVLGKPLAANEAFDLTACVGLAYLVTVGPKLNKAGQPTGWNEVTACIKLPTKK
jgi:hypothetical protein